MLQSLLFYFFAVTCGFASLALGLSGRQAFVIILFNVAVSGIFTTVLFIGLAGDYLHDLKVQQRKARWRLPFWLRWSSWEIERKRTPYRLLRPNPNASLEEGYSYYVRNKYWDMKRKKLIPIRKLFTG